MKSTIWFSIFLIFLSGKVVLSSHLVEAESKTGVPPYIPPSTPVPNITSTTTTSTTAPPNPNTTVTPPTTTTTTTKSTTTVTPTPPTTVTPIAPNTTTPIAPTTPKTTLAPVTTTASPPPADRKFDTPSFIGGFVLCMGLTAIGFISWKFYKARTERNYHTL